MNLFDKAKQLSSAAAESAQSLGHQVSQATQAAKTALDEATATGTRPIQQIQSLGQETVQKGLETLSQAPEQFAQAKQQAQTAVRDLSWQDIGDAITTWQAAVAGAATSGLVVTQALKDLPRTAQELAQEMPKLARRMQTAGVRAGDTPRTEADVMGLFNKIPGPSKLGASERDMRIFLADKHGSHIRAHAQGGGNEASNIVWEVGTANLRRGANPMTGQEQIYIRFANAVDSVLKNSTTIAKLGIASTGTAIVTQALVTALAHTLDLYRGDITAEEFRRKVTDAAVSAGIAAPIFFLILVAAIALFPELTVLLSAPAVMAGFNTLFGISIALPIVQSILRHVEAGGLGQEAERQYAEAIRLGDAMIQAASEEAKQWWQVAFPAIIPGAKQLPSEAG
ncbi:hypothetical protein GFS31_32370 [Leptolyngbya sp. BL0902]|uniref:HNH endonuclease n=1 Tax=Leptolyngbya sp. BL0902 TaxID=1115757 RepID=UPI0019371F35|nr:HNH endonuclease [Leptolyngbya sp. BL0902]QQE66538.1 hypothetical protein GFS31_32370 [Leptolyngbya sp. BL0902]